MNLRVATDLRIGSARLKTECCESKALHMSGRTPGALDGVGHSTVLRFIAVFNGCRYAGCEEHFGMSVSDAYLARR